MVIGGAAYAGTTAAKHMLYNGLAVMAVTDVFPSGRHSFGIDCKENVDIGGLDAPSTIAQWMQLDRDAISTTSERLCSDA